MNYTYNIILYIYDNVMYIIIDINVYTQLQNTPPVLRELEVLFAPHLPLSTISYYIDHRGVHGVESVESVDTTT